MIILLKQLTHSFTVCYCGNIHIHINDCVGHEEENQDEQGLYADLDIYG
jgi:hypothetical protein